MKLNYYEELIKTLKKKINAFQKQNYFEFFKDSPELITAFNLAYFVLEEEEIIYTDRTNGDIPTRHTLFIDQSIIDELFDGKDFRDYFPDIVNCEPQGGNVWFVAALRNSLVHGGVSGIDMENNTITIKNVHDLNKLECTIPLDFFEKFMNIIQRSKKNDRDANTFVTQLFDNKTAYELNYFLEIVDQKPLDDNTMDNISEEIYSIYNKILEILKKPFTPNSRHDETGNDYIVENEVQEFLSKINDYAMINSIPRNSAEYQKLLYQEIQNYLQQKISALHPDLQVSVQQDMPEHQRVKFLGMNITESMHLFGRSMDQTDFISEIVYLKNSFSANSQYIDEIERFLTPETQQMLFSTSANRNQETNMNRILNSIHRTRTQMGEKHSYGPIIIDDILNRTSSFFRIRPDEKKIVQNIIKEVKNHGKRLSYNDPFISEIIGKYQPFFERYNEIYQKKGVISIEDREIAERLFDSEKIRIFIENCRLQKGRMLTGLLYTYGINVYVTNKEHETNTGEVFEDDDFIRHIDMPMYTSIEGARVNDMEKHLKAIEETIKRKKELLSANLNAPQEIINGIKSTIADLEREHELIKDLISNISTLTLGSKIMAQDENIERKAVVIRNCLAHNGRITISEENKHFIITMTDSFNGSVTSTARCSLSDLLKFIEHDFRTRVEDKGDSMRPDSADFEDSVEATRIAEGVSSVIPEVLLPPEHPTISEPK